MIWVPWLAFWRPMTVRERKLADARAQVHAAERRAEHAAADRRALERQRASWDRMRADVARRVGA